MDWSFYHDFGIAEWTLAVLFVAAYLMYFARMRAISLRLKVPFRRSFIKVLLRGLYFSLLLIALLGPSFGEAKREIKSVGKDMLVLTDVSLSMEADDVRPNRLGKVKFELRDFISEFKSDRIGLIAFSADAYVQCPLTYDQSAISLFLETIRTDLVSNTGTDFAPALILAIEKLTEETDEKPQTKVIILISDGEDFGEEAVAAAEDLKEKGIKLFALGVGTEKGGKIPVRDGFKRDRQGKEVTSRLNAGSLKKLASLTEGKYFEINDRKNEMPKLIEAVSKIKGELRESKRLEVSANKYFYFLFAGLLLILLDVLITIKALKI